jgi:hypothetical protein
MTIKKGAKWTRSLNFKKYFASSFGISHAGKYIRFDFGDEVVKLSERDSAYISECQIIMDEDGFEKFFNLLKNYKEVKFDKKKKE